MLNTTEPLSPEFIAAYKGNELMAVAIAFIPIIVIAVCLRFYCRYLSESGWGADDYIVLVALFCQIGSSILTICGVKFAGSGHHLAALEQTDPKMVTRFFKWLLVDSSFYFFSMGIPKLAILCFYLRIFTIPAYRITVHILFAIVVATGIVTGIVSLNLCRPFSFNWDRSLPGGSCYNENVFYEWGSFPNILTDIAILILPMPIVWRLNTSNDMKIGLTLTFLTASIGLATSCLRFDSFFHGSAISDGTWYVELPIWTMVEPNIYLIAACLVTYRPLLKDFRSITNKIRSSRSSPNSKQMGSSGGKSAETADPSKRSDSAGQSSRRVFRGLRRMGRNDLESLGNTFDMRDTADIDNADGESVETGDEIRLVRLSHIPENGKEVVAQTESGPNQIYVRNDFYVKTNAPSEAERDSLWK